MPEGPEIRRAADKLAEALQGKTLTEVWFAFPALKIYQAGLTGQSVTRLETRGKALLTHFSGGLVLYSHNQLYGLWRVADTGAIPDTQRDLRVRLVAGQQAVLLYSASDIAMLNEETLTTHPFLSRLGPDALDMSFSAPQAQARLLLPRFRRRQLGGLLLDQGFIAGLGNYLRAEILWQAQLAPQRKAQDLSPDQLRRLGEALLDLPRLSYQTRGQTDDKRHHGAIFRFNVFDREGEPCRRCGAPIERRQLSGRPFFCCPVCQG
ncbi:endonuclease VIII [Affinibrenneria salicis]|uniref:DNA-(apurinic or apyrimidinic site) lyase n=1 Tax=Affinibrenneria salicis TaxID=2590031 RepID=A0A5J5G029_9GAMM|nr:endonuclease VIII [Affinibrenneria salicis]KAA8999911.1 endonuclease VIII [Affinibrenneria salicis]